MQKLNNVDWTCLAQLDSATKKIRGTIHNYEDTYEILSTRYLKCPLFLLVLALMPLMALAQPGLDPNVLLQNYRAIELAYAREVIRPTGIATPFDSQITFVQQVNNFGAIF